MPETINRLPYQLISLDQSLKNLSNHNGFESAKKVILEILNILSINDFDNWKLFNDDKGKIRSNSGWFMLAEGFADKRATYKVAENNSPNFDIKAYWIQKASKSIISWLVAITPNFEDEPFYQNKNVGIDFIIPARADKIIIVLSKNYVIRTLELSEQLIPTQIDILQKWLQPFDFSNKEQTHKILWDSFDLEPVNKQFFKEISSYFVELKQHLIKSPLFDDIHSAYFTNRLIGRLVFCWFLNKKGLINPDFRYFETEGTDSTTFYRQKLETLFFKIFNTPETERASSLDSKTPFLNGGLFEPRKGDFFGNSDLTFPADYFYRLIKTLNHYNFTTDESTSMFQQVAIDPEMLGRIFENLLAEQVEETGEQARKAKGAFYTPREIVEYMCRESLREYLKSKIPDDEMRDQRISDLLDKKPHQIQDKSGSNLRRDLKKYKDEMITALDEIKIVDPACGSGAFPMGMLQLLLQCYDRLEPRFDSYKTKLSVIKNNLFGIDIEPMAVEISRLRAWLSIIVDEEAESKKVEPLPNLDFKFVCANSLVPLEKNDGLFDQKELADRMQEIRDEYFSTRSQKKKELLKQKFNKLFKNGNQRLFSSDKEKQLLSYHPFDAENVTNFYDTEFMFGLKGFDVVIGNPPYVNSKKIKKNIRDVYWKLYDEVLSGDMDLYQLFFIFGIKLIYPNGILSFVSSNSYLTNQSFRLLREYMLKNTTIISIHDFPHRFFPFKSVNTETSFIILCNRKTNSEKQEIGVSICEKKRKKLDLEVDRKVIVPIFDKYNGFFLGISELTSNIIKRVETKSLHFSEFFTISNPSSLDRKERYPKTSIQKYDKCVFSENELNSDQELKEISEPCVTGDKILRYIIHGDDLYTNTSWIKDGRVKKINDRTYSMMKAPKLVGQRITGQAKWRIVFTFDETGLISMPSVNIITSNNSSHQKDILLNLLGVLNSKLYNFLYKDIFNENNTNITSDVFEIIPIPQIILENKILNLKVSEILQGGYNQQIDADIDELIFRLYDLSSDEIKSVKEADQD